MGFTPSIQLLFLFLKNQKVAMVTRRVVTKVAKVMTMEMTMVVAMTSQTSTVHCFSDKLVKGMTLILTLIIFSG